MFTVCQEDEELQIKLVLVGICAEKKKHNETPRGAGVPLSSFSSGLTDPVKVLRTAPLHGQGQHLRGGVTVGALHVGSDSR